MLVTVERTEPALGEVTVDWELTTTNSQSPDLRFNLKNGTLVYLQVRPNCVNSNIAYYSSLIQV